MNNFAAPKSTYMSAASHELAERTRRVELALYAVCGGMVLLLAAVTTVMTISQVA